VLPPFLTASDDGAVLIRVKAVPGARRDEIVGPLGDRLKVRVSAPPEGGRANDAVRALVADALGVRPRDLEITTGASSAEKTLRTRAIDLASAAHRLAPDAH
jgi:uncharacterized protein (TIGR00251 family)